MFDQPIQPQPTDLPAGDSTVTYLAQRKMPVSMYSPNGWRFIAEVDRPDEAWREIDEWMEMSPGYDPADFRVVKKVETTTFEQIVR